MRSLSSSDQSIDNRTWSRSCFKTLCLRCNQLRMGASSSVLRCFGRSPKIAVARRTDRSAEGASKKMRCCCITTLIAVLLAGISNKRSASKVRRSSREDVGAILTGQARCGVEGPKVVESRKLDRSLAAILPKKSALNS